MAKVLSRTVSIYVDGKQVDSTLKSLETNLKKLKNQQKFLTIGTEEYIETESTMSISTPAPPAKNPTSLLTKLAYSAYSITSFVLSSIFNSQC